MNWMHCGALTGVPSRRDVLRGLAGAGLGRGGLWLAAEAEARKKRKKPKKHKPTATPNEFGCLEFGDPCTSGSDCCSGMCEGKKDKRRCQAHDTGGCMAGSTSTGCGGANVACTTITGNSGVCVTTTGNAGYCMATFTYYACRTDVDCQGVEGGLLGPRAACIRCAEGVGGSLCASDAELAG